MAAMKRFWLFFFSLTFTFALEAQPDTMRLSLPEVVSLAQKDAPDVQLAKTTLSTNYWLFQSYLANYKPQIGLEGTLPNLNRSIQSIPLPDGSQAFVERSFMENSIGLSLQQDVSLTGGSVFAFSGLQRIDIFKASGTDGSTSYLSTPFVIGFNQPIFGFNELKWDKRIEPLRYEEANREYAEQMEEVAFQATNLFFQVLISQLNVQALTKNKADADTLYAISQGRFSVGRIAETELLQIELSAMNADASLAEARLNLQTNTERLRNFLGITEAVNFALAPPEEIPDFLIDADQAVTYAKKYRSESVAFRRRLKERERDIAQAEAQNGFRADIFGQFGLTQTADAFGDVYKDPLDQEQIRIGINLPIADWGKSRARLEIARTNQQLEIMNVEQDRINFEREILIKVQQFDLLRNQVRLAQRAFDVSEKRLDITRKRYLIGKIAIVELNIAIREQDEARRSYIAALRAFWVAYYELRRLTLFDFANGQPLVPND